MPALAGTVAVAPLVTPSTDDTFPTHVDAYGQGGLVACVSLAARDAISPLRRKAGMIASIADTGTLYRLLSDLVTWELVEVGGTPTSGDYSREFALTPSFTPGVIYSLAAGEIVTRVTVFVSELWAADGVPVSVAVGAATVIDGTSADFGTAAAFDVDVREPAGPADITATVLGTPTAGTVVVRVYITAT